MVHFEVMKHGNTANENLYCKQLNRLNESLIEKCPAINRKGVILQHDNTTPHCVRCTQKKLMN